MKIAIITGTVRKNRKSIHVANFIIDVANKRTDKEVTYKLLDLKDFNLAIFDEAFPPAASKTRETAEARNWSNKLTDFDAFIFVTAEYNRSIPGALKNAIDYIAREVSNKVGAIVSYGVTGGNSATDNLRLVLSRLGMNLVRNQPFFINSKDFTKDNMFVPSSKEKAEKSINSMLNATVNLAIKLSD